MASAEDIGNSLRETIAKSDRATEYAMGEPWNGSRQTRTERISSVYERLGELVAEISLLRQEALDDTVRLRESVSRYGFAIGDLSNLGIREDVTHAAVTNLRLARGIDDSRHQTGTGIMAAIGNAHIVAAELAQTMAQLKGVEGHIGNARSAAGEAPAHIQEALEHSTQFIEIVDRYMDERGYTNH
jgi:hypothetical protein